MSRPRQLTREELMYIGRIPMKDSHWASWAQEQCEKLGFIATLDHDARGKDEQYAYLYDAVTKKYIGKVKSDNFRQNLDMFYLVHKKSKP